MSAPLRRQEALEALAKVIKGELGQHLETETIDFKEEHGTVTRTGTRRAIPPRHEPAAAALAEEVACMANSHRGGVLIVGVNERAAGPAAIVGTYLDPTWLRQRIWALTQPSYSIDEIETLSRVGKPLYLINVAPALEEIRSGDKLRTRQGTSCIELTGDRAREFLEQRRGFDWTAEPSGMRFSSALPGALASARRHYAEEHGSAPGSDLEIARRMGILVGTGTDPELNRAGALLLCPVEPGTEQLQVLVTPVEGTPSHHTVRGPAPLLPLLDEVWSALETTAFPPSPVIVGTQRRQVRAVPDKALRESIVNAVMHRDYRQDRSAIVVVASGDPGEALKVRSPGGLPPGVSADRLLSTPSRPRNPALAQAMRVLGLAEREGVGVDTMYHVMLRDGHPAPSIVEDAGDVVVRLSGGRADLGVRAFFDDLTVRDQRLGDDVRATIAVSSLFRVVSLRPEQLAGEAQCTSDEALDVLERLADAGAVERLLDRSQTFRLGREARGALAARIAYRARSAMEQHWETIRAYLDDHEEIAREDVVRLLGVSETRASQILRALCSRPQRLRRTGPTRGRNVRYRLA